MAGWGMMGFQSLTLRPQSRRKLVLTNLHNTHTHTHTHGPSIHRDTYSPLTHELTNACCKGILTLSTRPSPYSVNTFRQATAQIRTGRHVCILALGVPGHLVEPPLPMHTLAALPLTPMH